MQIEDGVLEKLLRAKGKEMPNVRTRIQALIINKDTEEV